MPTLPATVRIPRTPVAAALLAIALVATACSKPPAPDNAPPAAAPVSQEAVLMEKGMGQLYQTGDPAGAVLTFREVLKQNPSHYGAHFQLARALDRSGSPAEARPVWEQVAQLADAAKDTTSAATARTRLAAPDTASQEAMMSMGLNLLYKQNDAPGATEQFRKVLEKNPKHYGAHFQIARALDKAGKPDEARPHWQTVLTMATAIKDQSTADTARARLQRKP